MTIPAGFAIFRRPPIQALINLRDLLIFVFFVIRIPLTHDAPRLTSPTYPQLRMLPHVLPRQTLAFFLIVLRERTIQH